MTSIKHFMDMNKCLGKLHFTTLNYASDYTLHPKLFECTVCTLNYDLCYILHPDISFTVKLDGNMKHVYCLSRTNIKDQKTHLPNQLKTKLFFSSLSLMRINSSPQIKIPTTLNPQSKIIFGTTIVPPLQ